MSNETWIVVGLGNPGAKYARTRHNAGFDAIDHVAKVEKISIDERSCGAMVGVGRGGRLVLAKPHTFMNASGDSIAELVRRFAVPRSRVIVIHDDVRLWVGDVDVVTLGAHGGHNGVKSVISCLGAPCGFLRVRVGVGSAPRDRLLEDHVMGRFDRVDRCNVERAFDEVSGAIRAAMAVGVEKAVGGWRVDRSGNTREPPRVPKDKDERVGSVQRLPTPANA